MDGHWAFRWPGFPAFWQHRQRSERVSNSRVAARDFTGQQLTKTFHCPDCSRAAEIRPARLRGPPNKAGGDDPMLVPQRMILIVFGGG